MPRADEAVSCRFRFRGEAWAALRAAYQAGEPVQLCWKVNARWVYDGLMRIVALDLRRRRATFHQVDFLMVHPAPRFPERAAPLQLNGRPLLDGPTAVEIARHLGLLAGLRHPVHRPGHQLVHVLDMPEPERGVLLEVLRRLPPACPP